MLDAEILDRITERILLAQGEVKVPDLAKEFGLENSISEIRAFLRSEEKFRYIRHNDTCSYNASADPDQICKIAVILKEFYMRDEYINQAQTKKIVNLLEQFPRHIYNRFDPFVEQGYKEDCYQDLNKFDLVAKWTLIHNEHFIQNVLRKKKEYFDTMFQNPLDEQQRLAVVTDEDNNLVVASAGSGKTSTIIAKARYLVEELGVSPKDILVLTYTKKAAQELRTRIGRKDVDCLTFHSHACKMLGIKEIDEHFFERVFDDMMKDKTFLAAANKYLTIYSNLWKYDFEYKSAKERARDLAQFYIAPYPDKDGYRMYVRSKEELELCVILTELGLQIKYEEDYQYSKRERGRALYKPDFSIYFQDRYGKERRVYLEHFGVREDINGNYQVPEWFGEGKEGGSLVAQKMYLKYMDDKIKRHKRNNTTLLYTTSGMFQENRGNMREIVQRMLKDAGVPIRPISEEEKMSKLEQVSFQAKDKLRAFLEGYVALMKVHQYSLNEISIKLTQSKSWYRERNMFIFRNLLSPIYTEYQNRLQPCDDESTWSYDFTDALYQSIKRNKEFGLDKKYKYILVDEYQDMSEDKFNYLTSWRSEQPFTKIFCVGDDWQSIYRFAGSKIELFTNFRNNFKGKTAECKIEKTHRFGNPLADISSSFILGNKAQKVKHVIPADRETQIEAVAYHGREQRSKLEQIINALPPGEILLLARYWKTFNSVGLNIKQPSTETLCGREVECMTIHQAKGLNADNVILLECNNGMIPSIIQDDPMLSCVLSDSDSFPDAEERRLFYVAITRAKQKVYILYDQYAPSYFIEELGWMEESKGTTEPCPWCHNGHVLADKPRVSVNGTKFVRVYCSNYDTHLCDYKETIFENSSKERYERYCNSK